MSKCQKNKYAAGGKCGSMSSDRESCSKNEVNTSFAALLASREKQDALLFNASVTKASVPKEPVTSSQAIIIKKTISKSDIDIVLEGDF